MGLGIRAGSRILARQREAEGPFGEFTGHYSGGRNYPVIEIDRVSHCKNPIYEACYLGMPWIEIDYLLAINTCAPLFVQLKNHIPEAVAVNAMFIHGFVVIVSMRRRYGGFAKAVGLRVLSTPHGLGYAKTVIVVNEASPVRSEADRRGNFSVQLDSPERTQEWRTKLNAILEELHK